MKMRFELLLFAVIFGILLSFAFSPTALADGSSTITSTSLAVGPTAAAALPPNATGALNTPPTPKSSKSANLPESKIPVFLSKPNPLQKSINPWGRMLMSFLIIGLVGGGMMFFAKWYSGRYKKNGDPSKIRILTQFHLGPKKSLAIVRVAGESILIGVTDHNISMLKSLSLLDDEVPTHETPANFQRTLAQTDEQQAGAAYNSQAAPIDDEFQLARIKDRISVKLKDLRRL